MKKLISILSSDIFFFLFFSLIALSLNYAPAIYHFLTTPPDRVYTGTVFFSDDYAIYASTIQQGIDGRLMVVDKYTSEPHEPSLLRINYLLLGKIGGLLELSSMLTYHLSRFVLGIIFLSLCLYLIFNFIPKNLQRLSFLFLLFSYSWPKFNVGNPVLWLKIQPALTEPNPVVRFATQPHFQIGAIYTLIAIIFFLNLSDLSNLSRRFLFLFLSSLFLVLSNFAALTDPSQVLVIYLALFFFILILVLKDLIAKRPIFSQKKIFIVYLLAIIAALPPYFYLQHVLSQEPWLHILPPFENMQAFPQTFSDFFLSFGPIAPFATIGIFIIFLGYLRNLGNIGDLPRSSQFAIGKFDNLIIICFFWILSTIILIFFLATPLHINRLRLFHTPLYIPLAILGAYGVVNLSKLLTDKVRISYKMLTSLFTIIILGLSMPLTYSSFMEQVKFLSEKESALIYPPKTHVEAYNFLRFNTNHDDIVLSLYESGSQIPYFSGNTVFLGNITETLNEGTKSTIAQKIFSGQIQSTNLQKILVDNRIRYLFIGYQEAFWQTDFTKYPFLSKVYQNPGVSIFKVL